MDEKFKEIKEELTLLLIYLTGWEEDKRNAPGEKVWRAWKGYNFDVLNNLQTKNWIYQIPGGKSVVLQEKGKQEVELLMQKYIPCFAAGVNIIPKGTIHGARRTGTGNGCLW